MADQTDPKPSTPTRSRTDGVLSSHAIAALIDDGAVSASEPVTDPQIQPASLDLRLGPKAYRVRASFLPGQETVDAKINRLGMHAIDLTAGAVLERGCVYIVPLMESLALEAGISAHANPKSSTGRLDIFTRLITDHAQEFDRVRRGYRGPLYAEVSPRTFSIVVHDGSRLNQLRFKRGAPGYSDRGLQRLHEERGLIDRSLRRERFAGGLPLTVDLAGNGAERVGWKAKRHTDLIDLDKIGHYEPADFWEPIGPQPSGGVILNPDDFYILASKEAVRIPPDHAAEMVAYDTLVGEFRAHYAGFFDPGFGHDAAGGEGTRAVLEVRSHDVPFVIEDGQTVGRLLFEPLTEPPGQLYGQGIGSSYQSQQLALAKQFIQNV
jgi:dCTP deaminase